MRARLALADHCVMLQSNLRAGRVSNRVEGEKVNLRLQEFCREREQWLKEFGTEQPAYCLPPSAIEKLAAPYSRKKRLAEGTIIKVEREFSVLCESNNAVGLWDGCFVHYPCLRSAYGLPAEHLRPAC